MIALPQASRMLLGNFHTEGFHAPRCDFVSFHSLLVHSLDWKSCAMLFLMPEIITRRIYLKD